MKKNLCLHFHNTYAHPTWQSGNLLLEESICLVRWPFDHVVTWEIENLISALLQYLWPSNLAEQLLGVSGGAIFKVTWTFDCVVTWQMKKSYKYTSAVPMAIKLDRVQLTLRRPNTPSHVTFWSSGLVTNARLYISTSAVSMTTKLDRVVTCDGGTPTSRACDLLVMWSRDKWKKLFLYFHNTYGHQTWQSDNVRSEDPIH